MFIYLQARDGWGFTPLHRAAHNGQTEAAELLLKRGSSPTALDNWDFTPLKRAALRGHKTTVKLLTEHTVGQMKRTRVYLHPGSCHRERVNSDCATCRLMALYTVTTAKRIGNEADESLASRGDRRVQTI